MWFYPAIPLITSIEACCWADQKLHGLDPRIKIAGGKQLASDLIQLTLFLRKKGISELLINLMLNDLNTIEIDEFTKHGALLPRKHKVQVARKGNSVRSLLGEEHGGARVFAEGICWALGETCKVSLNWRLRTLSAVLISCLFCSRLIIVYILVLRALSIPPIHK